MGFSNYINFDHRQPQEIIFKVRGVVRGPRWHRNRDKELNDTRVDIIWSTAPVEANPTHWLVISSLITSHVTKGRPCDRLLRRRNRILPVGLLHLKLMYRIGYSTFQQRKGIRLSGMQGLRNRPEARKDASFTSFTN